MLRHQGGSIVNVRINSREQYYLYYHFPTIYLDLYICYSEWFPIIFSIYSQSKVLKSMLLCLCFSYISFGAYFGSLLASWSHSGLSCYGMLPLVLYNGLRPGNRFNSNNLVYQFTNFRNWTTVCLWLCRCAGSGLCFVSLSWTPTCSWSVNLFVGGIHSWSLSRHSQHDT